MDNTLQLRTKPEPPTSNNGVVLHPAFANNRSVKWNAESASRPRSNKSMLNVSDDEHATNTVVRTATFNEEEPSAALDMSEMEAAVNSMLREPSQSSNEPSPSRS